MSLNIRTSPINVFENSTNLIYPTTSVFIPYKILHNQIKLNYITFLKIRIVPTFKNYAVITIIFQFLPYYCLCAP
jgi:hypothetical protein